MVSLVHIRQGSLLHSPRASQAVLRTFKKSVKELKVELCRINKRPKSKRKDSSLRFGKKRALKHPEALRQAQIT